MDNNSLTHWGIKGMRWGVRRYQNKDGSLTPAGKKRYDDTPEETLEQKKERILKTHSAKEIYNNKDIFTDKEIADAFLRLNNEANIKRLIPEEVSKVQKFVNGLSVTSKTIKSVTDSSDDIYKSVIKAKNLIETITKKAT